MEPPPSRAVPEAGESQPSHRLRTAALGMIPLLLGACPSTAWVVATLLPQTGPVAWGTELLALGATPCLIAGLDVSGADWRTGGGEKWWPLGLLGRLVALALALLAVISAINLSAPDILYSNGGTAG